LQSIVRVLQYPHGILISVSFATQGRILLLQREVEKMGLSLRFRFIRAGAEWRLITFIAHSFNDTNDKQDEFTNMKLESILYDGPMWDEDYVNFEHPKLCATVVLEQTWRKGKDPSKSGDTSGNLLWPAARSLAAHLITHPELVHNCRVVELGAGVGLLGIVAGALGAKEVVMTDVTCTIPLLQRNLEANRAVCGDCVSVEELWWGTEEGPGGELANVDVVLGCELLYRQNVETCIALINSITKLIGDSGICLLLYEGRDCWMEDVEFFDRVNAIFDVEVMSMESYGYGFPGERFLYTYRAKRLTTSG